MTKHKLGSKLWAACGALALFAGSAAHAYELTNEVSLVADYPLKDIPAYFFKVSADGRYYSYSRALRATPLDSRTDSINTLFDSQSASYIRIPGAIDPVFVADSGWMVIPVQINASYGFYRLSDLVSKGVNSTPVFTDTVLTGFYHSLGTLEKSETEARHRIIIETANGHLIREYKENVAKNTITAVPNSVHTACPDQRLKLPMIAKNGREMAALDLTTGTTKVFSLGDDGHCKQLIDLKVLTGKVAFSYDGRWLAYHRYSSDADRRQATNYVYVPSDNYTADVFIYDRKEKKTYQVTHNLDSNSLYPEFLLNGDVVFVDHPYEQVPGRKTSFVRVHVKP